MRRCLRLISEVNYGMMNQGSGIFVYNDTPGRLGSEATVTRNTVFNTAHSGILLSADPDTPSIVTQAGNEVSYNDVFNANALQGDMGGIEAFGYAARPSTSCTRRSTTT